MTGMLNLLYSPASEKAPTCLMLKMVMINVRTDQKNLIKSMFWCYLDYASGSRKITPQLLRSKGPQTLL